MKAEPQEEHRWLEQLLGEWEVTSLPPTEGDQPQTPWTENVRSMQGLWVVCEGKGTMPDGSPAQSLMTLGFNPQTNRYVGTWVGSMMTHMWVYDGVLEDDRKTLTLNCEGPDFDRPGRSASYQDVITLIDGNHRTLTARVQTEDGSWKEVMAAEYRRR
ncbi:DUF1579 domain-containing protein [Sinorhizobium terangae]|uniref:DUF1579 domain-containing protein n=1 Tax=Sinorhizobium terangae TaxID=110322 RepID=A0A6N7LE09_SINTE|nr:DUF1579 domain-containing protein [Sinorhizobium terangae]MBB4186058.1 hypothetical protein [Sinorhizobium terangae]MQX15510.1 DUF1579 domain-containing protein [Sinorhizobium terangae]WFU47045.1 DUF1579 domain-containing protein [Sinorhizobium terangae]